MPVWLRESTTAVQKYIQPSSTRLNIMPPLHVDDDHFGKTCPSESEEMWQCNFFINFTPNIFCLCSFIEDQSLPDFGNVHYGSTEATQATYQFQVKTKNY